MKNNCWISAYLYYQDPLDDFLVSAVNPFVKEMLFEKIADHYFFIRYWKNGSHIRLRFSVNSILKRKKLKTWLVNFFENYFRNNPSIRNDKSFPVHIRKKLVANNSIRFVSYLSEYERYGGIAGVEIAKKQFEASSNAVLEIIGSAHWNYDRAIGAAIEMHIILFYVFHKNIIDSIKHLQIISQSEQSTGVYKKNFNSQKNTLVPYVNNLIISLKNNTLHEKPWMENWHKSMVEIYSLLNNAQSKNLLSLPKYNLSRLNIYWPLLASYLHMTNNRLGIKTTDEPYIAYLLKRSFESL